MFPYRNFGYSRFVLIVSVAFLVFGVVSAAKTLDSRWSGSTGIITKSFLSKPPTSPSSSNDKPGNRINVSSLQASGRGERTFDARSMASVLDPTRQGADSQAQFSLANTQASLALALHLSPSAVALSGASLRHATPQHKRLELLNCDHLVKVCHVELCSIARIVPTSRSTKPTFRFFGR